MRYFCSVQDLFIYELVHITIMMPKVMTIRCLVYFKIIGKYVFEITVYILGMGYFSLASLVTGLK